MEELKTRIARTVAYMPVLVEPRETPTVGSSPEAAVRAGRQSGNQIIRQAATIGGSNT